MPFFSQKMKALHLQPNLRAALRPLGERGFSTVLVIIISALVSGAILGVLQLSIFNSQNAERAIAFSQYALLKDQVSAILKSMPDSIYCPGGPNTPPCTNACKLALGNQSFNTADASLTGSASPELVISNEAGVFLSSLDPAHNTFGKLTITSIKLVPRGVISADASGTVYRAQLLIIAKMTNASPFDRVFRDVPGTTQDIWLSVGVGPGGPGLVPIVSCHSNFFVSTRFPLPMPLPVCNGPGQVLFASETGPPGGTGIADTVSCVNAVCPTGTGGWKQDSGFTPDGNAICP